MAFLVLFSTLSFSVDMHFCGGSLVDVTLSQEKATCSMALNGKVSEEAHNAMKEMGCCEDVDLAMEGQEDLQLGNAQEITPQQQYFLIAFNYSYLNLFDRDSEKEIPYKEYSPPLLTRDVQILDQTFLI